MTFLIILLLFSRYKNKEKEHFILRIKKKATFSSIFDKERRFKVKI